LLFSSQQLNKITIMKFLFHIFFVFLAIISFATATQTTLFDNTNSQTTTSGFHGSSLYISSNKYVCQIMQTGPQVDEIASITARLNVIAPATYDFKFEIYTTDGLVVPTGNPIYSATISKAVAAQDYYTFMLPSPATVQANGYYHVCLHLATDSRDDRVLFRFFSSDPTAFSASGWTNTNQVSFYAITGWGGVFTGYPMVFRLNSKFVDSAAKAYYTASFFNNANQMIYNKDSGFLQTSTMSPFPLMQIPSSTISATKSIKFTANFGFPTYYVDNSATVSNQWKYKFCSVWLSSSTSSGDANRVVTCTIDGSLTVATCNTNSVTFTNPFWIHYRIVERTVSSCNNNQATIYGGSFAIAQANDYTDCSDSD